MTLGGRKKRPKRDLGEFYPFLGDRMANGAVYPILFFNVQDWEGANMHVEEMGAILFLVSEGHMEPDWVRCLSENFLYVNHSLFYFHY